jgi:manganese/zinc/iron transport system permease protein
VIVELSFTARNVLLGSTLLGALGGVLGCFALLRRQSLLGDALAHAALPGVCLAFLWTGSKDPLPLALGALIAGLVGAMVILGVVRWSRIKEDSSIGIVLSVFFGLGIVLLTYIQRLPSGNQSGLDKYLFGQAATLMERDLAVMAILDLHLEAQGIARVVGSAHPDHGGGYSTEKAVVWVTWRSPNTSAQTRSSR